MVRSYTCYNLYIRYYIDTDNNDLCQIHGSKLLEMLSCPTIPRLDIVSSTFSIRRLAWETRFNISRLLAAAPKLARFTLS